MAKNDRAGRRDEDELDYEDVVEEEDRPRRKKRVAEDQPPRKKRVEEDDQPRRKNRLQEDDERRPRREVREENDEPEPPRRKKKKKKKSSYVHDNRNPPILEIGDKITAGLLLFVGLVLCFASAVGLSEKGEAFRAMGYMLLSVAVTIPVTVGTLMALGMLVGIDYGEYKAAIIKLTAISMFNNGLLWGGQWLGLPTMFVLLICGIASFSLFMTLFQLDPWETNISMFAINIVQFVARFILIGLLVASARYQERVQDRDDFDPPTKGQPRDSGRMPPDDDGDEP